MHTLAGTRQLAKHTHHIHRRNRQSAVTAGHIHPLAIGIGPRSLNPRLR
jgi:hypothetical protein